MNPYTSIWFKPKQTFQHFFESDERAPLYFLPILVIGISMTLDIAPEIGALYAEDYPFWIYLLALPIGIGVSYLVIGLVFPGLTRAFGKIWGGKATLRQMTNVYSLAFIPFLIIVVNQLALLITGQEPTMENINAGVDAILRLWTLALLVFGVSQIQKFSYGIALLNVLITHAPFVIISLIRQ